MTFWEFLSNNTFSAILIGVLVVVTVLLIARLLGVKSLSLSGAEFFSKGRSADFANITAWVIQQELRLSEMRCAMVQRHTTMRLYYLLRDQMNMAEQYISEIYMIASQVFTVLHKEQCDDEKPIVTHPEFLHFERELEAGLDYLKSLIRFAMKENHLAEKSDEEFRYYVQDKTEYISTRMRQWVMRTPSIGCIDNETFLGVLDSRKSAIKEVYRKMFELARQQAIAYESAIRVELKDFEQEKAEFYRELPKKLREALS